MLEMLENANKSYLFWVQLTEIRMIADITQLHDSVLDWSALQSTKFN